MSSTPQVASPSIATTRTEDIPVSNPDGISSVYSNNVAVSATMTDFSLYFLEIGQIPGSAPVQRVKSIVTLPLSAAMGMQEVLRQMLEQRDRMVAASGKK
jgi:hypothetical protein